MAGVILRGESNWEVEVAEGVMDVVKKISSMIEEMMTGVCVSVTTLDQTASDKLRREQSFSSLTVASTTQLIANLGKRDDEICVYTPDLFRLVIYRVMIGLSDLNLLFNHTYNRNGLVIRLDVNGTILKLSF